MARKSSCKIKFDQHRATLENYGGLEGTSTSFFLRDFFFYPRLLFLCATFFFICDFFFYARLLFLSASSFFPSATSFFHSRLFFYAQLLFLSASSFFPSATSFFHSRLLFLTSTSFLSVKNCKGQTNYIQYHETRRSRVRPVTLLKSEEVADKKEVEVKKRSRGWKKSRRR